VAPLTSMRRATGLAGRPAVAMVKWEAGCRFDYSNPDYR
jgi:hypothetical protein